jgi:hypothetical protein
MADPKVVDGAQGSASLRQPVMPDAAWRLVAVVAASFLVVGGTDVFLTWYPLRFGSAEWEFGTVTASLNGLPVPILGLAFLLASSVAVGWRLVGRGAALACAVGGVLIVLAGVMYATDVPMALRSVSQPVAHQALMKAITKTTVQLLAYPVGLCWLAVLGWRYTRAR